MNRDRLLRELVELRELLAAEAPARLNADSSSEAVYEHRVGMPFTPQFRRYLSHPEQWGSTRLGMLSILEVREWCWQRHPAHRHRDKALCERLLIRVAYWGHDWPPGLDNMLGRALQHAAEWRAKQLRPRLAEPLPYQKLPSAGEGARVRPDGQRTRHRKGRSAQRTRASGTFRSRV